MKIRSACRDIPELNSKLSWLMCQGERPSMEDLLLAFEFNAHKDRYDIPKFSIALVVLDGHGGRQTAEAVKDYLQSFLASNHPLTNGRGKIAASWRTWITTVFHDIDKHIKPLIPMPQIGSTCTFVVIGSDGTVCSANAGDSLAQSGNISDKVTVLTHEHKVSAPMEFERIGRYIRHASSSTDLALANETREMALLNLSTFGRVAGVNVSRCFGDFVSKGLGQICTPYTTVVKDGINQNYIFVASDGVWDVLSHDQVDLIIKTNLINGIDDERICQQILQAARPESTDNIAMYLLVKNSFGFH